MLDITASVGRGGINREDDVRRVQYLLNKTSPANGGPATAFDTVPGANSASFETAIENFQHSHSLVQDGRVDPGRSTITKLNALVDLTAFNAAREPEEFLSWLRRPPQWNFTLEDLLALHGTPFSFTPSTAAWLPVTYQANIIATILAMLNPLDTLAGCWGVGAWDFYHGHVVVPKNPATGLPFPSVVSQTSAFRPISNRLEALNMLRRPETLTDPAKIASFTAELNGILADATSPLNNLFNTGAASIFYHSFESSGRLGSTSRYSGFNPADARRNWLTPLAPLVAPIPTKYASADHPDKPFDDFIHIFELSFLVEKSGKIGVAAETKMELIAVTGQPYSEIE